MLKTPPSASSDQFSTPKTSKHQLLPLSPQSMAPNSSPNPAFPNTPNHNNSTHIFSTPVLSVNTNLDQTALPLSPGASFYPSPLSCTSPISKSSGFSAGSSNWHQMLPNSTAFNENEIISSIEDSIIDPKFSEDLHINKVLGKGSFSTVLECYSNEHNFAVKIPKNLRCSKQIFKEMLNFKIISNYLQLNNFDTNNTPILNAYGLISLTKSNYPTIRHGEKLPCLVSENLSINLESLIQQSKPTQGELHIGNELWWKLTKQLILGLTILKNCSMIHLDLKTSNILFDSVHKNFKIADLTSAGLQQDIEFQYYKLLDNDSFFDVTLQYCPSELINNPPSKPSFQTDLYAVGLILLSSAIGEEPYSSYLKTQNPSTLMIVLNECIRKNKILDLIPIDKFNNLKQNKQAFELIRMILIDRCSLEDVLAFMNDI